MHSLYRLLKCTIGGLHCHVITTEYRTRVHCIHMLHIGPCNLFGSIWSMFSYNTNSSMVIKLVVKLKKDWTRFIQTNSQPFVPADWKQKPQTMSYSHALSKRKRKHLANRKFPGKQTDGAVHRPDGTTNITSLHRTLEKKKNSNERPFMLQKIITNS